MPTGSLDQLPTKLQALDAVAVSQPCRTVRRLPPAGLLPERRRTGTRGPQEPDGRVGDGVRTAAEAKGTRDCAFTYLDDLIEEVREAGRYVYRDDEAMVRRFPSKYWRNYNYDDVLGTEPDVPADDGSEIFLEPS